MGATCTKEACGQATLGSGYTVDIQRCNEDHQCTLSSSLLAPAMCACSCVLEGRLRHNVQLIAVNHINGWYTTS